MNIYDRPSSARMVSSGGGNIRQSDGTLRSVSAGRLLHALTVAPLEVRLARAKVARGLPLTEAEAETCRVYLRNVADYQ